MSQEMPTDDSLEAFREARESVGDVLKHVMAEEGVESFTEMQQLYFRLRAGEKARDPDFQAVDLPGTRLNIPNSDRVVVDNPSVEDRHGEVIAPTKHDQFRVLDGLSVLDPTNPFTTHAVTVDHVITPDGDVRCEVNGVPLDEVGQRAGSHIP